jgi:hypothetical protein
VLIPPAAAPRPQRQPADAARRHQHVRPLLRHPDLVAEPPAEAGAEDATERDHIREARPHLEEEQRHEPAGLGVGEALADLVEAGEGADQEGDDQPDEKEPASPAREPGGAQFARQRFR